MSNNARVKSGTESDQTEQQHAHLKRSHHDATLINPGPPALYRLNTERKQIEGNYRKDRQWIYGQKDESKQNKVILMVGETGAGKTTMINTMINYLLGVKFEDQEFYQLTEEQGNGEEREDEEEEEEEEHKDQSQSQTSAVTVYEVFVEENPTSLTIIDTPGYGHTEGCEKDAEVAEYLSRLFSDKDGIHYIDAVCFVMKASQNRLSGKELYIFHSVLSLFGRDIENNIVFLLTHSDGLPPTDALNAIKKAEIPCRKDEDNEPVHFLFKNRQKVKRHKRYKQALKSAWEMGEESMNEFFTLLEEKNRKSIQMTLDVLIERRQLEASVSNLKERISQKEFKIKELTQIQEALRQNREKIQECKAFAFTVKRVFKEKVLIGNVSWKHKNATCCSVCEENCHERYCWWANVASKCSVMKGGNCTVCTGKCHHSKHIRENKKYVIKENTFEMTFDELKQELTGGDRPETKSYDKKIYTNITDTKERNMRDAKKRETIEEKLNSDLEKIKSEKSILLHEAYISIMRLSKIALKADSALTLQHLDFMIPRLKEEGNDEWMKNLDDLRKAGEEEKNKGALRHVLKFVRQKEKKNI